MRAKLNALFKTKYPEAGKNDPQGEEREEEPGKAVYGESSLTFGVASVFKNILTILGTQADMPPFNRSYDESFYVFYDLNRGAELKWESSFSSKKTAQLFDLWVIAQFPTKFTYNFPGTFSFRKDLPTWSHYDLIPSEKGIAVSANENMGGHYFEENIGTLAYKAIPQEWLKPTGDIAKLAGDISSNPKAPNIPILTPSVSCPSESVPEMTQKYQKLLIGFEKTWELAAGDMDARAAVEADFAKLTEELFACPPHDAGCAEKSLNLRSQQ